MGMITSALRKNCPDMSGRLNIHRYLKAMHKGLLKGYGDVTTVGEMPRDLGPYEASKYVTKE